MMAILVSLLGAVALSEFSEWCPRLAEALVRWSARRLSDVQAHERYEEEYLGNLAEVPGKVSKLLAALGYVAYVPKMRRELRAEHRDRAESAEQSARDTPPRFFSIY